MFHALTSRRHRAALMTAAAASVLSLSSTRFAAHGATFGAAWGNFATGNYATASNWGASSAPNDGVPTVNDYYNVTINRALGATVTGNMSPEILNLTIGAGNALSMNASSSLSLIGTATNGASTLSNAGTITLGSNAQLNLLGSSTNVSGNGTIILNSGSGIGGSGTVTTNNTIRGIGSIGKNQIAIVNDGIITSDAGGIVTIDPRSSGGFVNNNDLVADNDSFLILTGAGGGSFNNFQGQVLVGASSNVQLDAGAILFSGDINVATTGSFDLFNNSSINGVQIFTTGTGRAQVVSGHTGSFVGVFNFGNIRVPSTSTGIFTNTTSNSGTINVTAAASDATLSFGSGTSTFTGTGTLNLSTTGAGFARIAGTGTLVNSSTITGAGSIGMGAGVIRNTGTIRSSVASQFLTIEPVAAGTGGVNSGTLISTAGDLFLKGGTWTNTGTIQSDGSGHILLADTTINGGTLVMSGTNGLIQAGGSNTISGANVTIGPDAKLGVPANGTLTIRATVANAGEIEILDSFVPSGLNVGAGGSLVLNGGGILSLGGTGSVLSTIGGSGQLNNVNNTIHGKGKIGLDALAIVNSGTIASDVLGSGVEIAIDPGLGGLTNTGTILATNGAGLTFDGAGGGAFTNAGGTITSLSSSSIIELRNGATITGGTLATVAGSQVRVFNGQTASTLSVFNSGRLAAEGATLSFSGTNANEVTCSAAGTLILAGDVANTGSIHASGSLGTAHFRLGGGTINLTGGSAGLLDIATSGTVDGDVGGSGTLVSNNRITGAGLLGMNQIAIVNNHRITADRASRTLTIDPISGGNLANTGTLEATNGGILALSGAGGGFVTNSGTVSASNGTVLLQNGVSISGGTVRSDPTGEVQVDGSTGGIAGVTNTGTIDVSNGTLTLNSTINNTGTISVVEDLNAATLAVIGVGATLTGGGQVRLGKSSTGTGIPSIAGVGPLTNANHTIRGRGFIGRDAIGITNSGTIAADQAGNALFLDPASTWVNSGTLTATGGGILELVGAGSAPVLTNATGRVIAATGSNVRVNGATISGGTLSTVGTGTVSVGQTQTGTLDTATNLGNLTLENGATLRLAPGSTLTNSGSINVVGSSLNTSFGAVAGFTGTLTGGGVVNLSGGSFGILSGQLVNLNNTIRGTGHILDRYTGGPTAVIDADVAGQVLQVTPAVQIALSSVINNGLARATNGGILEIASGGFGIGGSVFDNVSTGTILAANGSMVHINGSPGLISGVSIATGTILTSGTGTVLFDGSVGLFNVNLAANAFLSGGGTLNVTGTTSTGTLQVLGIGTLGGGTFTNAGLLSGGIVLDGQPGSASPAFVLNNTGTIEAVGTLGFVKHGSQTPPVLLNDGTVHLTSGITVGGNFTSTGTFAGANGTLIVDAGATFGFMADPMQCGTLILNGNAVNLAQMTANTITGTGKLTNTGLTFLGNSIHGTTTFQSSRVQNVEVADGTITTLTNGGTLGTSRVTNLVIHPVLGHWNLNDNDLVVDYDVDSPLPQYRAMLLSGRNGGAWNGPGLMSAAAAANPATGFGIINAIDKLGPSGGVFSGQNVDGTTLLIKYTWNGDANLDGRVTFDDYVKIDTGFNTHLPGYNNGDFNYDGVVNFDDYVLIDIAFNQQNGTLGRAIDWLSGDDRSTAGLDSAGLGEVLGHLDQFGMSYGAAFLAAVPEPTVTLLAATGALASALGSRNSRRCRRRRAPRCV